VKGRLRDEVVKLIQEAIELHIEGLKADGLEVPAPHSDARIAEVTAA
jgi:predicted RNase H-like HicB family nuclease